MKMFSLILGITVLTASFAQAGKIVVTPGNTTPEDRNGTDVYQLVLDPTGMENTFDTIEILVMSDDGSLTTFAGEAGIMELATSTDTGFSAFLTAPPSFGGQGLSPFGVAGDADVLQGTFASLGSNDASASEYIVANIGTRPGGQGLVTYAFFDDGAQVGSGEERYGIPEPGTLALAGLSLVAIAIRRRS